MRKSPPPFEDIFKSNRITFGFPIVLTGEAPDSLKLAPFWFWGMLAMATDHVEVVATQCVLQTPKSLRFFRGSQLRFFFDKINICGF